MVKSDITILTELYPRPNERKGGKGAVPVTIIDLF